MKPHNPFAARVAALFVVVVLGVIFAQLAHLYHFVSEIAAGADDLVELAGRAGNSPGMYVSVIGWLLALSTVVLPVVARGRAAAWTTFVIGILIVALPLYDGLHHGLSEGIWFFAVLAIGGIAVPGVWALAATWRWARTPAPRPEG